MSELWAYNPEVCDGDYCPMNCDICSKGLENYSEEEDEPDE